MARDGQESENMVSKDQFTVRGRSYDDSVSGWSPFWMRRVVLLTAAIIFAALATALGLVNWYSLRHSGVINTTSDKHYLWTYVPVLCFTLLAIAWGRTEYRFKQMQPWQSLAQQPAPAAKSVNLDYVTPINFLTIFPALRNGHFGVAAVLLTSLVLQLVIVLSTGLFALKDVQSSSDVTLALKDMFVSNATVATSTLGTDFRPAAIVIGIARYNLSAPPGTTSDQAYQQFTSPHELDSAAQATSATVDVLASSSRCEPARLTFNGEPALTSNIYTASAFSASCSNATFAQIPGLTADLVSLFSGTPYQRVGMGFTGSASTIAFLQKVDCGVENATSVFIYAGQIEKDSSGTTLGLGNHSSSVCHLTYGIHTAPVTLLQNGSTSVELQSTGDVSQLPGLVTDTLWTGILSAFSAGSSLLYTGGGSYESTSSWYDPQSQIPTMLSFFKENLLAAAQAADVEPFEQALGDVWAAMNAQFAELYLKTPVDTTTSGQILTTETRLTVRQLPFWLVEASLIVITLVAAVLSLTVKSRSLPRDLATITGLISVLVSSPHFVRRLVGTGTASERALLQRLGANRFSIRQDHDDIDNPFAIQVSEVVNEKGETKKLSATSNDLKWFRPVPATVCFRVGVPILLAGMIVCLEVLYRQSTAHDGLTYVSSDNSLQHLAWTYVPALVMVSTAALISTLHFNAALLQPYLSLHKGPATAQRSISRNYLGADSFLLAVKDRKYGLILASICAFASSFLTIAVAGLYTAENVPSASTISLQQLDVFDRQASSNTSAGLMSELVIYSNLSYPTNTFGDLAFVRSNPAPLQQIINGTAQLSLGALQGRFNCSDISDQILRTKFVTIDAGFGTSTVPSIDLKTLPDSCNTYLPVSRMLEFGQAGVPTPYDAGWYWDAPGGRNITIPAANAAGNVYGGGDGLSNGTGYFGYLFRDPTTRANATPECPQNFIAFGRTHGRIVDQVTILSCNPYVASLVANVSLSLPEQTIDITNPPVPDEQTATTYDFDMCNSVNSSIGSTCTADDPLAGIIAAAALQNSTAAADNFDGFFSALLYAANGTSPASFTGSNNTARLLSSVEQLWGVAMAQYLNQFRTEASVGTPNITGSVLTPRERLVQSKLSTRLLEVILGLILLCMLASFPFLKMNKLLSKSPSSIAAVASLLAGSELLSIASEELARNPNTKEMFKGYMFSLGWWSDNSLRDGRRFGIDIGKADERASIAEPY